MKIINLLVILTFYAFICVYSQVTIYPVLPEVKLNPDFIVRVDDGSGFRNVPVQDIVDVCFVHFEFSQSIDIEISVASEIYSYRIGPESLGICPTVDRNKMTFRLDYPAKIIVLINDGAGNHNTGLDGLCIIAETPEENAPEITDPDVVNILDYITDNTGKILETDRIQKVFNNYDGKNKIIYFPAGIYKSGMLHIRNNQSVYLAPGAVLLGSSDYNDYSQIPGEGDARQKYLLGSWKSDNIKVFGRGIINGNGTALRMQDPTGAGFKTHNIQFQGSRNVVIEDIICLDAGSWAIETIYCDSVSIKNIKLMSDLRYYDSRNNTDGIDINNCQNVNVEDCLIWSGDDAISIKQDGTYSGIFPLRNNFGHYVSNILVYTRKCAVKIGTETKDSNHEFFNMIFQDFDVVYADRAISILSHEGVLIHNITFKGFRIEKISDEFKRMHIHCQIDNFGNSIKNISFIDIAAKEPAPQGNFFEGNNLGKIVNGERVQFYNIRFKNYTIGENVVLSLSDRFARFKLRRSIDPVSADSSAFTFEKATGIGLNSPTNHKNIRIWPNPSSSVLYIDFKSQVNTILQIFDMKGHMVRNYQIEDENFFKISTNELPTGPYILKSVGHNLLLNQKIFIFR